MRREKVEDPSPLGKLADPVHLVRPRVACAHQKREQLLHPIALPGSEGAGFFPQKPRRHSILQRRARRCDHQPGGSGGESAEHTQPGVLVLVGNAGHLMEGQVAGRIERRDRLPCHDVDVLTDAHGVRLVGRDNQPALSEQAGERIDQVGLMHLRKAGRQHRGVPGLHRSFDLPEFGHPREQLFKPVHKYSSSSLSSSVIR